jgi:hypothetical protein
MNAFFFFLVASETYIRSIIFFYSSTVIHTILLGALPSYTTSLSDILPCFYYGAGLIAVLFELSTLRLNAIPRHILFYTIVGLSAISFFKLSHFAYSNDGWTRSECESTKLGSIDCIEFPPSEHLQDAMPGSVSVKLPGKTENIRYNYGEEIETDEKIASLKEMEYLKAREEMTHRYHRAIPTPTLTPEEAVKWGDGVYEGAKQREEKHKAEAKKKVEEELVKKRALEEEERKKKEEKEAANAEKEQLAELKKDEVQKTMKNVQKKKKKQAMPDTQEVEEE